MDTASEGEEFVLSKILNIPLDVSCRGSVLSNVSIFLDQVLRPSVLEMKSYIRDTGDFLSKITNLNPPPGSLLVTLDVVSLYTSIQHHKGINAIRRVLNTTIYSTACKEFIISLLDLVLTKNYFLFGDHYYLQLQGTAMGSNVVQTSTCH